MPVGAQRVLKTFDFVNDSYNFLSKRHMSCTLKNLTSVMKSFGSNLNIDLTADTLASIASIDPKCIQFVQSNELAQSGDIATFTIIFLVNKGLGAAPTTKRRTAFRIAMTSYLYKEFHSWCLATYHESDKSIATRWSQIESSGWPDDCKVSIGHSTTQLPTLIEDIMSTGSTAEITLPYPTSGSDKDYIHRHLGHCQNASINCLLNSPVYSNQIRHIHTIDGREAVFEDLKHDLASKELVANLLSVLHIRKFYRHQARGIDAVRDGKHLILSTATASGKSVVFNVPAIDTMLSLPSARALYLFPTKVNSLRLFSVSRQCCVYMLHYAATNSR